MNKNHSGHYSVGMIAAVLISLSAVCPFASIHAAPSAVQENNLSSAPNHNESFQVPSTESMSPVVPPASPGDVSSKPPTQQQGVPDEVKQTAADTVQSLSSQPPFASWKDAELSYHPLGPGTHSWLVQVNHAGEYIGYLIIGSDSNGAYQLNEYGNGPGGPYSMDVLRQSLKSLTETEFSPTDKLQITPMYEEPLLAYWLVRSSTGSQISIDAVTGDPLPVEVADGSWKNKLQNNAISLSIPSLRTQAQAVNVSSEPFDPYDDLGWLQPKHKLSIHNTSQFMDVLNNSRRMIFSATSINFAFGGPLSISGYQAWISSAHPSEPILYALTYHNGLSRFVPLQRLLSHGEFLRL
ncbi:hypothetical protein L8C07_10450 [Paenibacillus sp. CMAA1739]|uniref:hypothetical protein n=1 Tax=Paenibacillus ottowii TaxID=2315729 RepID=UPI00272F6C1A|nr:MULTISPECIES: hypothetical protein [Paenibacillus]MDP1511142.1 hypothetical protein [Paenibacillus ottowii]MEC4566360.1 hypothetical protein [Paenibacillus sp. CMAA1739]